MRPGALVVCFFACGTPGAPERGAHDPIIELSAGAAAPPSSDASSAPRSQGRGATTPGKIQCETLECDLATEVCCVAGSGDAVSGRCLPKPAKNAQGQTPWVCGEQVFIERYCDEAADCPAGQGCCAPLYDEWPYDTDSCGERCDEERCLAGSTCTNGNLCRADEGKRSGECPMDVRPPSCGAAKCKLHERCCWDAAAGKGRCAADCGEESLFWFSCSSPADCAGERDCSTWPGVNQYRCGGSGFQGRVLCRTLRDCPKHLSALGSGPGAPVATSCTHTEDLPPGVKECGYGD